jgi:chaperone required for assembly of F1-ATPase
MRRFYKTVSLGTGGEVLLDGRPVRTPMKALLRLPFQPLAEAVAEEWRGQGAKIDPRSMPLTRLANTAIDRVSRKRSKIQGEIIDFAGSDLVCYRASQPAELRARQAAAWDPAIDWALKTLDAQFEVVFGIVHRRQPVSSLQAFTSHLSRKSDFQIAGLHNLTTLTGSALLASMVEAGVTEPETAWLASNVDEDFQIEQWGQDEEAARRRLARTGEFLSTCRFLHLLGEAPHQAAP